MLADNWDRGSLYSYRAFSFPSEMPYETITQPVMFITGEKDGALTKGAKKVHIACLAVSLSTHIQIVSGWDLSCFSFLRIYKLLIGWHSVVGWFDTF